MNTTEPTINALAKVERAVEKRVPKPTKRQILKATALAIIAERKKQFQERIDKLSAIEKQACALAVKYAKITVANASLNCYTNPPQVSFHTSVKASEDKELAKLLAEHRRVDSTRIVMDFDTIYKQLAERSITNPDGVVSDLLNDEDIRAKLVKAGNALLTTPTSTDKASAIAV